jgi:hypothetical protein
MSNHVRMEKMNFFRLFVRFSYGAQGWMGGVSARSFSYRIGGADGI